MTNKDTEKVIDFLTPYRVIIFFLVQKYCWRRIELPTPVGEISGDLRTETVGAVFGASVLDSTLQNSAFLFTIVWRSIAFQEISRQHLEVGNCREGDDNMLLRFGTHPSNNLMVDFHLLFSSSIHSCSWHKLPILNSYVQTVNLFTHIGYFRIGYFQPSLSVAADLPATKDCWARRYHRRSSRDLDFPSGLLG